MRTRQEPNQCIEAETGIKRKGPKRKITELNWYRVGQQEIEYKTVLFVPITKGGKLLKEMKKREEEINRNTDERIKMIEGGGIKMKDMLVVKQERMTFHIGEMLKLS